jgi:hypothetical protein
MATRTSFKLAILSISFFIGIIFISNRFIPITKQEMIEIAKSHRCPLRLELIYGDEASYYDYCISTFSDSFGKLPSHDKKDVAINFIVYGNLDTSPSEVFLELIQPYQKELLSSLENISDSELQNRFEISKSVISGYRKKVAHYKNIFSSTME